MAAPVSSAQKPSDAGIYYSGFQLRRPVSETLVRLAREWKILNPSDDPKASDPNSAEMKQSAVAADTEGAALAILPSYITAWYRALAKAYSPEEIRAIQLPPLSQGLCHQMNQPLTDAETAQWGTNPDGTPYLVRDVFSLYLSHPSSVASHANRMAHHRQTHPNDRNTDSLTFLSVWKSAMDQLQNIPRKGWGWVLIAHHSLPGTQGASPKVQEAILKPLGYVMPPFSVACSASFDHVLATNTRLFSREMSTRTQEKISGFASNDPRDHQEEDYLKDCHPVVSHSINGISVFSAFGENMNTIAVFPLRKLPD